MPEQEKTNTVEYVKIIKNSTEKKRSYIFLGFTVVVAILLAVFAIRPTITTITKIKKEIETKTAISANLDKKISALSSLDTEYLENKKSFNTLSLLFPSDGNFSLFLSNIDSITQRNGFVLDSIVFDDYDGDSYNLSTKALSPKTVRLTVTGDQAHLKGLLEGLEALPMYPVIESVSFSVQGETFSFSIEIRIYEVSKSNFYN